MRQQLHPDKDLKAKEKHLNEVDEVLLQFDISIHAKN